MKLDRIGVIYPNNPVAPTKESDIQMLRDAAPDAELIFTTSLDEFLAKVSDVDALITMPILAPEQSAKLVEFCKNAPSLKWIHCMISGVDSLLSTEIADMDILITSTKGIQGYPIGDTVIALMYAFLRNLHLLTRSQVRREWNTTAKLTCNDSYDKTVAIIGVGYIGMEIARKLKLLGYHTIGAKRTVIQSEWLDECYTMDQLHDFLPRCDFVVLICPLTPETYHLIGAEELKLMKKTAVLINVARGAVVDDDALVQALKDGEILGAGLDIFVKEPLQPDNPYYDLENVIIDCHIGPMTPYVTERTFQVCAENIRNYANDLPMLHVAERGKK